MTKPTLTSFTTLAPLIIQEYERYLHTAFDDGLTMLQKVNKMMERLNQIGIITNDLVVQWNSVMEWVMNEGLEEEINQKLTAMSVDGTLDEIINQNVFGDLTQKANNPLNQITDIPSSKLKTATDADKIQVANLSSAVISMMNGLSPTGTIPAVGSVTSEILSNEAVTESKMGFIYRRGTILAQTIDVNTTTKTINVPANTLIGHIGIYYTMALHSVVYTGLNTRVQFVYLNPDTLQIEVYETGTVIANKKLILLFSFYNGKVQDTTTPNRITIDGRIASKIGKLEMDFRHQRASVLLGSIAVNTLKNVETFEGEIVATGVFISSNGYYFTIANQTISYTNPQNRVQYVYVRESTKILEVYATGLAPADPDLHLLFSFYNGKISDSLSLSGITVDGGTPLSGTSNTDFKSMTSAWLGDSITKGDGGSVPYPTVVQNVLGLANAENFGVSGTSIARRNGRNDSFVERFSTMPNGKNIVAFKGGVNDFWTNVPLGTMGSVDDTTFYGALDVLVKGLITKYPNAFILGLTPTKGYRETGYPNEGANTAGHKMDAYVQAVKDVCGFYTIPVLDLKHELGIDPSIPIHFSTYTSDGIHFKDAGYNKIGKLVSNFIKAKFNN
jgi:lysophospholipase L1-like esterase